MYPSKQIFLVLGLSRSGRAAAEFLLDKGAQVYIYDDLSGERIEQTAKYLEEKGAKRLHKDEIGNAMETCDALVLSPGVPIDHPLAVAFRRKGRAVLGETELAARYMRCPVIAVTGTNGKTTTVSMLAETLQKGGMDAVVCGNIGTPMVEFYSLEENKIAVAEISSFQLETLNSLCPHIAVILNITEDHLNRHYNMENYTFLKGKLLKNCSETEYAVLNYDDETVRSFAEKTKAKIIYFSVRERINGAFYENGYLYFGKEKIMHVNDLSANGLHNVQNALAVIAAAKLMGVKSADIAAALSSFKGIRHRIQEIAKINGVTYIDDSKGTNVDATLKAIAAMKAETVILLGGKNKGYRYEKLFTAMSSSRVVHAILYGENRYALLKAAMESGFEKITLCDGFDFAVRVAAMKAKEGQCVLLSPASASFDEFASYEERGEKFAQIVCSFGRQQTEEETQNREERIETADTLDEEVDKTTDTAGQGDDDSLDDVYDARERIRIEREKEEIE